MKNKLNELIESFATWVNNYVEQTVDFVQRCWPVVLAVTLSIWLLMPEYDMQVVFRLVTTFTILLFMSWAAGRVFWTTRTKNLTSLEQVHRDYMYAGIIAACALASATASL